MALKVDLYYTKTVWAEINIELNNTDLEFIE